MIGVIPYDEYEGKVSLIALFFRDVAQSGSAPALGAGGLRFEP